eukprot:CAMPEP_0174904322 /NCGR_PEP_ID=MMETSP0167-20121228/48123_1 /TAXON_ID=38298 /ORGANISM="Rhodella maculata, Strain CCMP736" /LENGTH=77 /DNA_ID=CAMNT_0016146935 /DNA_START=125 /DNA_END=358 /DNA_ORIENTATION=+
MQSIKLLLLTIFFFALTALSVPLKAGTPKSTLPSVHHADMLGAQLKLQDAMLANGMSAEDVATHFSLKMPTGVPTSC